MKRIILLGILTTMIFGLTSCNVNTEHEPADAIAESTVNSEFYFVGDNKTLVYNTETKVIYYMFSVQKALGTGGYGYSYFAPYISENGKYCRYIDGEIVEIVETEN